MYKDKSKLFNNSFLQLLFVIILLITFVFSLIGMVFKSRVYKKDILRSSTPIGSEMRFEKSQSDVALSGIYTDEAHSVLIARLSTKNTANLPYKGLNYNVYLASKSLNEYTNQKTDILFGRLGVDGDLFMVIPKPIDEVYTVVVSNKKYMGAATNDIKDDSDLKDLSFADAQAQEIDVESDEKKESRDQKSVASMLSQIKPDLSGEVNTQAQGFLNKDSNYSENTLDLITFRIGLTTAKDEPEYKPIVLKGKLLVDNKFQFESFFNQVFKDEATKQTNEIVQKLQQRKKELKEMIKDYDERLLVEPNSGEIIAAKENAEKQLEQIKEKQIEYNDKLEIYHNLTYTKDYFNNLQTKASIINPEDYGLGKQ